ncbi:serine protease [Loktanella sp. TSTF-M6]|uniref:Serine protease n=1 Tax=Loktanella gaetbuli TaxID=2881335 RepID=A0ABS8BSX0_9RHOB|nr:serine protease [Loktanella gaetbuli]MCB5198674.1 serine protease [Loktanella gaetbuli]
MLTSELYAAAKGEINGERRKRISHALFSVLKGGRSLDEVLADIGVVSRRANIPKPPQGTKVVVSGFELAAISESKNIPGQSAIFISEIGLESLEYQKIAFRAPMGFQLPGNNLYLIPDLGLDELQNPEQLHALMFGFNAAFSELSKGIVRIDISDAEGRPVGTGSGVLVKSADEIILVTCAHCLISGGALVGKVELFAGEVSLKLEGVWFNENVDLAICKVSSKEDIPFLGLSAASALSKIFAAGYPRLFMGQGNPLLVHSGEVNGFVGRAGSNSRLGIMSCQVSPGNSGGPVFGENGLCVGIVSRHIENRYGDSLMRHNAFLPIEEIFFVWEERDFVEVVL